MSRLATLSTFFPSSSTVTALALGLRKQDRAGLRSIFCNANWNLYETLSWQKGLSLVREHGIRVVICDIELTDAVWKIILQELRNLPTRPRLVASVRLADHQLWDKALNLGAYDFLTTPFERSEVRRVVSLAWYSNKCEEQRATRARKRAGHLRIAAVGA